MSEILIKNGFIATMDRQRTVYPSGELYIKNDKIVEVGEKVCSSYGHTCKIIDATHKVVLPGFVNTHTHLQQYLRGLYELIGDFYKVNLPLESYRQPEDMEYLALASCAELIYGGCTTSVVIYTYPDGFARAVEEGGNRCIIGVDIEEVDLKKLAKGVYEYLPEKGAAAFERAIDFYNAWHGKANGRISVIMAPKAPDFVTEETYLKCKDFADAHGLRMTTHLSQSYREVQQVRKLFGKTPPQYLRDLGVLDSRLTGAHCTYLTEDDIRLIADSGMGILHCRAVRNPLARWMDMGIPIGLGTDDYHHDMLQLIRQNIGGLSAGAEETSATPIARRPSFYEFLELATRRGAEVLGIDHEVGSLEPGKKADIIIVDMDTPYLTPTQEPLTSIVLYASPADIDTVIVDGRILKKDGVITSIDVKEALADAQLKCKEIIDRFFRDHPDQRQAWMHKAGYTMLPNETR